MRRLALAGLLLLSARPAAAERPVTVDAAAVRFYAPDLGGVMTPRFITERELAFEARLLALEEDPAGTPQARHVRAAVEAHVTEAILASLPLEPRVDPAAVARAVELFRAGVERRVGGRAALERAEQAEGIAPSELATILVREARAAVYVDRAVTPLFAIDEDRLRETYRTTSNPFRGHPFETIRDDLARWLTIETFRAAEQAYLQSARSRITIVYL